MTDRIVGQPSNLTTASAGTGGNVRMTYAPWELDWEFFDLMTVGVDFLANITTAASAQITAKGGAENLGYWFEVGVAFPSANWNTGDRITPQRQAAIWQYANFAAAVAAMANDDFLLIWYANTANRRLWINAIYFNGKGGSAWGMLSRNQVTISENNGNMVAYGGDLSGMGRQAVVVNLSGYGRVSFQGIYYGPTVGKEGMGFEVRRNIVSGYTPGISASGALDGKINIYNNLVMNGTPIGIQTSSADGANQKVYGNTVVDCVGSFNVGNLVPARNNVVSNCYLACFSLAAACQNCADTDGSLPVHATNLRNQTQAQLQFFHNYASPGQKKFPRDFRIHEDSVLTGAGLALAAVPRDADGRLRPALPSIGAYEPYGTCYAPAAGIIRELIKRGVRA